MDITKLQSQTADYLKFALIIAVVFIHSPDILPGTVNLKTIEYSNISGMDVYSLISSLFSVFLSAIAVPLFFMLSGFFMFYNLKEWSKSVYFNKIKSRVKTLLIPYFIWNLFTLIALSAEDYNTIRGGAEGEIIGVFSLFDYIKSFFLWKGYAPYLNPMWFIRDLMVLCLLSPIFYYLIKYLKVFSVIIIFIAYYFNFWPEITGIASEPTFYFLLGAFLSITHKNIVEEAKKIRWICLGICIISLFVFFYTKGEGFWLYVNKFYVFSGIAVAISLTAQLLDKGKIKVHPFLTKASFFIFALHQLVLLGAWRRIYLLIVKPVSAIEYIIGYFLVPCATILTCLVIYYLLQRFLPSIAAILTGNRNNIKRQQQPTK